MKPKIDKGLQDFLEEFNLGEREVMIYLTLLKTGPNTIMNLSRETGIKRSTTHNNVEELIKKGLVSQTNYGERRMVIAEDPEKLKFLMEQKKWRVKKLEDNLPNVIASIQKMVPESREQAHVEVKYYDGEKSVMTVYEEALSSKELRSYVNLKLVTEALPDNAELFMNAQSKNPDLKIWEIVDESEITKEFVQMFSKSEHYHYKINNGQIKLTSIDTLIYDDKVAIINIKDTVSAVVIHNKEYYQNIKTIFEYVWSTLK